MPSITKVNNRYSNLPNLKSLRKKRLNIFTDSIACKNDNIIRNKSKESIISPINSKIISYLDQVHSNNKKSNNITEKNKKVSIPSLIRPKNRALSKGLSILYKLYVSNDLTKNSNVSDKKGIYLPNLYIKKKVNEKRSNSNSHIASKKLKGKKIKSFKY